MESDERTGADFRAARERLGLTIADVAEDLGTLPSSVRRWEFTPGCKPSARAWELLDRYAAAQRRCVEAARDTAMHAVERMGGAMPAAVPITYYRSQAEYDEFGRDPGRFGVADANARVVGAELERYGFKVCYRFPGEGAVRTPGSRY